MGRRLEYRTRLLLVFVAWWLAWAYRPWHLSDWVLENILTVVFVTVLILTRNKFRLSSLSYTLIFVFMALHTVGAHYTYADVPYEQWTGALGFSINKFFGFERNHFDRLVHFLFGFLLAYPVREVFMRVANARGAWSYYLPVELVMSLSMVYEIVEWGASLVVGGDLGMAYLGTQGDVWDAHKDMALASAGAILGMLIVATVNWRYQRDFSREFSESLRVKEPAPLGEVRLREYKTARRRGRR